MAKEKLVSLMKYKQDLVNKLSSPIPEKHKNRPKQYEQYLKNEIEAVDRCITKAATD